MLGNIFDLKEFHDSQPKILNEITKRINPDLKFYYWTGVKERYREFELPSFNKPSGDGILERLDQVHISKRGDPGVFVANRASLPQKGELTARAKFHKAQLNCHHIKVKVTRQTFYLIYSVYKTFLLA